MLQLWNDLSATVLRDSTENNDVINLFRSSLRYQELSCDSSVCISALSWCNVTEQPLDVTANGYKHGVTKKDLGTAKARWR